MAIETFTLRKQELARRVASLTTEVAAWKTATQGDLDAQAHFSQVRAIEILTKAFVDRQDLLLAALNPGADPAAFKLAAFDLVSNIIRGQKTWDFFRDKLDLRHSPTHKHALWVADTVAWDCHRPILDEAVGFGIIPTAELREPPLIYCSAEFSPATWVRNSRPNDGRNYDLGETRLPIPVIEIPWDTLHNGWDYLALHHEVGHDIEADLRLRPSLRDSLQTLLTAKGVSADRIKTWVKWEGEIFADLCALRLAGPAFGDALASLLMLPDESVTQYDDTDPHPTPYVRILLCASYARALGGAAALQDHANALEAQWKALYGASNATLAPYVGDFDHVCEALMETKLAELLNHTVAELIPFGDADDARIRAAATYFRTGMNMPAALRPRYVPSAARLAVDQLAGANGATAQALVDVQARIESYVKGHSPPGLRGGGPDAHEKFIASFVDRIF